MLTRLYSTQTGGAWLKFEDEFDGQGSPRQGSKNIANSFLVDCLTSTNLVVLMGLGTSQYLNPLASGDSTVDDCSVSNIAPTMWDLWSAAREKSGCDFNDILDAVAYAPNTGDENIENLLSKCKMALDLWAADHPHRSSISDFVRDTENIIPR